MPDRQRTTFAVQKIGPIRDVELMGKMYRVFSAVLVREQVLINNLGRAFLPKEEIAASVEAWNGMPVVVDHPKHRGVHVSARDPAVLNARGIGFIFNVIFDAALNALKGDVYLDPDRVAAVEGASGLVANVERGTPGEVSTGFATAIDPTSGAYGGEPFDLIMRNITPDHLAILPEAVGACSVRDGCGLGVNADASEPSPAPGPGPLSPEEDDTMPDKTPSRSWLARFVERVTAPASANERITNFLAGLSDEERASALEGLLQSVAQEALVDNESDQERLELIRTALREKYGTDGAWLYVLASFSAESYLVFEVESNDGRGAAGIEDGLYRIDFEMDETAGVVTFPSDPVKVRKVTSFEPVANAGGTQQEGDMERDKVIAGLAAASGLRAEVLQPMTDEELVGLQAKYPCAQAGNAAAGEGAPKSGAAAPAEPAKPAAEGVTVEAFNELKSLLTTTAQQLATVTNELGTVATELGTLKGVTADAVQERDREKGELVTALAANERCPFSKDELEAKDLPELRKLAVLAKGVSYAPRGIPRNTAGNEADPGYAPVRPYYETSTPAEA